MNTKVTFLRVPIKFSCVPACKSIFWGDTGFWGAPAWTSAPVE